MSAHRLNRNQLIIENDRLNKRIAELEEMLAIRSKSVSEEVIETTTVKGSRDPKKVSVIMPNFNCSEFLERAIKSVLNQTHKNFELIIVDDNSTDDSLKVINKFASHDSRIRVFKNIEQRGTYWCKNAVLDKTTGSFITILDSDDYDSPRKLEKQLNVFENPNVVCVTCLFDRKVSENSSKTERVSLGYPSMMYRYSVFEKLGYYDSVKFGADSEFYDRVIQVYGKNSVFHINEVLQTGPRRSNGLTGISPEGGKDRIFYVNSYRAWHSSGKLLKMEFPTQNRHFQAPDKAIIEYADLSNIKEITSEINQHRSDRDRVFVGIAAIPTRVESFKKTIDSLINQVNEIGVYLNGWDSVPEFLKHPKIKIQRSQQTGNVGDAGKFFWIDNYSGYYFTCDDDIVYPKDYIQRTINKIEHYNRKAVIGFHGSIILPKFKHYYDVKSRRVLGFNFDKENDEHVHILGTGTIGFHTSTIRVKFSDFKKPNMADIFFAKLGQEQSVPFIVQEHSKGEMYAIESRESISGSGIKRTGSRLDTSNDQNKLVTEINWKIN